MRLQRVLEFSFSLFKKDWRVVLPNVLNWVPFALLSLLILNGFNSVTSLIILKISPVEIFKNLLFYASLAIPLLLASLLISFFLSCAYCEIVRQAYSKRKISLVKSFKVGKKRFIPLFGTYVLAFVILLFFNLLLIPLIFLGIWGILLFLILIIFLNSIAFILYFEIPAVVVLENSSGISAIKKSVEIGRKNFWSLVFVIFLTFFIVGIVNSSLSQIPFVGLIVSLIGSLFLNAWIYMIPAVFYLEFR